MLVVIVLVNVHLVTLKIKKQILVILVMNHVKNVKEQLNLIVFLVKKVNS